MEIPSKIFMNVKELILKQNPNDIIRYMQDNFIADYEDKEEIKSRYEMGFTLSLEDIQNTTPKENTEEYVIAKRYHEVWTDSEEDTIDVSIIKKSEILNMDTNYEIHNFDDMNDKHYPECWSFMFLDWEEILGYQVIEETIDVSELEFACYILWELTFFGYTKSRSEENSKKEMEILDKSREEVEKAIETGDDSKFHTLDDEFFEKWKRELGIYDGMNETEIQEKRMEDKIQRENASKKTMENALKVKQKEFELFKKLKKEWTKK